MKGKKPIEIDPVMLCTLKNPYTIPSEAEEPFVPLSSFSLKDTITILFLQVL